MSSRPQIHSIMIGKLLSCTKRKFPCITYCSTSLTDNAFFHWHSERGNIPMFIRLTGVFFTHFHLKNFLFIFFFSICTYFMRLRPEGLLGSIYFASKPSESSAHGIRAIWKKKNILKLSFACDQTVKWSKN